MMNEEELQAFEQLLQVLGDTSNRFKISLTLGELSPDFFDIADNAEVPFQYAQVEGLKPRLKAELDEQLNKLSNHLHAQNADPDLVPLAPDELIDQLLDVGLESIFSEEVSLAKLNLDGESDPYTASRNILRWVLAGMLKCIDDAAR